MANLPEIYFQVNDSNALKSIACVADVILIAMVSDLWRTFADKNN